MLGFVIFVVNTLAAILLLGACSAALQPSTQSGPASPKKIGERENGSTVALQAGGELDITLDANATTGFRWEIAAADAAIARPMGEPEYKPQGTALGSGGQTTFRFEAVAPGQTIVKLIYHRPFEQGVPPARTFQVNVVVK